LRKQIFIYYCLKKSQSANYMAAAQCIQTWGASHFLCILVSLIPCV